MDWHFYFREISNLGVNGLLKFCYIIVKFYRVFLIMGFMTACSNNSPVFPIRPKIEFLSISKTEIKEFDDLDIVIKYQDGDGDLGNEVSDSTNYDLFLLDQRPGLPTPFYDGKIRYNLPNLTTETRKPSIQGTIKINVQGLVRLNSFLPKEKCSFGIFIKDRAGHHSDTVFTPDFYIIP